MGYGGSLYIQIEKYEKREFKELSPDPESPENIKPYLPPLAITNPDDVHR